MVAYRYQTIVQLNGITSNPNTGTSEALSLYYSTSPTINTLYEDYIRYPLVQSSEVDVNQDGLIDRLELNIQMPLQSYEEIHSINCFVYHNVQFNGKTKMLIDTGSYFSYSHALPMGSLTVEGDLEFKQTWPLSSKGGYVVPYESDPLLPTTLEYSASTVSSSDVSLKSIMKRYTSRNCKSLYIELCVI